MANNFDKYYDMLKKSRPSETTESDSQKAGAIKRDAPFGGFPPLFICSSDVDVTDEENKNRQYSTHKGSVSIKDIMQRRRALAPLITVPTTIG